MNNDKLTAAFVAALQAACRNGIYMDRVTVGECGPDGIVVTAYGDSETDAKAWLHGYMDSALGRDFLALANDPKVIPPEPDDGTLDGFFAEPAPAPQWRAERIFTLADLTK